MQTKTGKKSDFDAEMELIDNDLSEFGDDVFATPINSERITKYVYRLYQRASLSGILDELNVAETAINEAIRLIGPADDLYYLKANLDFKLHRLDAVKDDIKNSRSLGESLEASVFFADIDFRLLRFSSLGVGER